MRKKLNVALLCFLVCCSFLAAQTLTPSPTPTPTVVPTTAPTVAPTTAPTVAPTIAPTIGPTNDPTIEPTVAPTDGPTAVITPGPTSSGATPGATSPVVSLNGQLQVLNARLCGSSGGELQLRGMSSHGIVWFPWSPETVYNLTDLWGVAIVRAAMYVVDPWNTPSQDYLVDPAYNKALVRTIVDAAIAKGIYVIIDWHILSDGDPTLHTSQAVTFFQEMATSYGSYPNVIYEICNEPNGLDTATMWTKVKAHANTVIPAIRAIDPDNIIIVGTPTWSQDVDYAAADPLTYDNICYALHFYAGSHGADLRSKASAALTTLTTNKPKQTIFVSEWGTCDSSGNAGYNEAESTNWLNWMTANNLSWCNWSVSNKPETAAVFDYYSTTNSVNEQAWRDGTAKASTGANMKDGPWAAADYTQSGEFVNDKVGYSGGGTPVPPSPVPTPGLTPIPGAPKVTILYQCYEPIVTGINAIRPWFEVRNDTTSSIALSDVKIRYFLNKDNTSGNLTFTCDYAQVGTSYVTGTPVQRLGEEYYMEFGFATGAGSLAAGANSGPIQIRIYTATYANFNQANDYSFLASMTSYGTNTNIAGYYQGALVFGSEAP